MLVESPSDFVLTISETISVTWPFSDADMFCHNAVAGALEISSAFMAWCLDLGNWSLDRSALIAMPQAAGKARFR